MVEMPSEHTESIDAERHWLGLCEPCVPFKLALVELSNEHNESIDVERHWLGICDPCNRTQTCRRCSCQWECFRCHHPDHRQWKARRGKQERKRARRAAQFKNQEACSSAEAQDVPLSNESLELLQVEMSVVLSAIDDPGLEQWRTEGSGGDLGTHTQAALIGSERCLENVSVATCWNVVSL